MNSTTYIVPTPEQLADSIKAELVAMRDAGNIPAEITSFAVLHDFCDANCLGDCEALFDTVVTESATDAEHDAKLQIVGNVMTPAQSIVDAWLKNGWK